MTDKNEDENNKILTGMIVNSSDERLNESNIEFFDFSSEIGKKPNLKYLNLKELDSFSIMEGEVIGIRGDLTRNKNLIFVKEIIKPSAPPKINIKDEFHSFKTSSQYLGKPFLLYVASGPFTHQGNLDYSPLCHFLEIVKKEEPHYILLIGPFIDENNLIASKLDITVNNVSISYKDIQNSIIEFILQNLKETNTKLLLLPSLKEINNIFPIPQPPMKINFDILKKYSSDSISYFSNPQYFEINDICIMVISGDIISEIIKSTLNK